MKRLSLLPLLLCFQAATLAAPAPHAQKAAVKKPAATQAAPVKPKAAPIPPKPPTPVAPPAPAPPPVPVEAKPAGPRTWALLVGVSKYQSDQIASLKYPAVDASGLGDVLTNPALGGLAADQVKLLTDDNATREQILGAVDTFLKPNVAPGDKVIVFLAGHGIAKGVGTQAKSYLLPTDVNGLTTQALEASAVNLRTLADKLGQLPASQFLVFVDACREDPTPGRGVKGNNLSDVMARGIQVIPQNPTSESATFFACSVGQRAYEDPAYGHGVFTNWIIQGISKSAVPEKPNGTVDMGRLSSYVEDQVAQWAKNMSANGDFDVQQTPELVSGTLSRPLVLMNVSRPLTDEAMATTPPRLLVAASPPGAKVTINGVLAGSGTIAQTLPEAGEYQISVTAPGYAPVARSVRAMGGYQQEMVVQLQPGAGGPALDATDPATAMYNKAARAAEAQEWEVAEQGYLATIATSANFTPAYEALIDLYQLEGRNTDAIAQALLLLKSAPHNAHALSLLARAYSRYAEKGAGDDNATTTADQVQGYGMPTNADEATDLARRAANDAVAADPAAAEGALAQGYALATLDTKGKNRRASLAAFGKAVFLDATNPANQLGLGYGLRYYGVQQKKDEDRKSEVTRAIAPLKEAIRLRPGYYEAHRELAYCYTITGDNHQAWLEYCQANAHCGAATDPNEIAANDVAMAGLCQRISDNSTGNKKVAEKQAADGYVSDAHETAPDFKTAMALLNSVGAGGPLSAYLPPELQQMMDIKGTVNEKIRDKIPGGGRIKLPF